MGGFESNLVIGGRFERTEVESVSLQIIPQQILWVSDNDFRIELGTDVNPISQKHTYQSFLPNIDFSINLTDELKARASYSMTLARPTYNQLFTATTIGAPGRPTYLGGTASGSRGNAGSPPSRIRSGGM